MNEETKHKHKPLNDELEKTIILMKALIEKMRHGLIKSIENK